MAGKTNYFGTFLDTVNAASSTRLQPPSPVMRDATAPTLDTLLKVWPEQDSMSVADVAGTFNLSVDTAADLLLKLQATGLADNKAGRFKLTPTGLQALKQVKRV
jgi:Mn-dependent DtxR family transcriptional regulator